MTDSTESDAPDWTQPCPAPLRCAVQTYCPPACRAAGNREGNNRVTPPGEGKS